MFVNSKIVYQMRVRECFVKKEPLLKQFDEKIKSGKTDYEAARDIIIAEHILLHNRLNEIRDELKVKKVNYV